MHTARMVVNELKEGEISKAGPNCASGPKIVIGNYLMFMEGVQLYSDICDTALRGNIFAQRVHRGTLPAR